MKPIIVTEFKRVVEPNPSGQRNIEDIFNDIKTGKWKTEIELCRNPDKNLETEKKKLPLFTPTGVFKYRNIAGIIEYNGLMCLDVDKIDNPEELKTKCKSIPWVYCAFITPSGKGLKVIVKTNATIDTFKQVEESLATTFNKLTGFERDNRCKDLARVQYISYDETLYLNKEATIFKNN